MLRRGGRARLLLAVAAMLPAACAHAGAGAAAAGPASPPDMVPTGTLASAELRQPLSTERSHAGDRFTADLLDPLVDETGRELAPRGAVVEGELGPMGGRLRLQIRRLREPDAVPVPFAAEVVQLPESRPSALRRGLLGALAGAAAGAGTGLAADAQSGAVVGGSAVVGAGVGALVGWLLSGSGPVEVPAGSVLTMRLTQPFGPGPVVRRAEPAERPAPSAPPDAATPAQNGRGELER
jgi:hypothetical protein